jgi:hypothetical protein
MDSIRSLTAAGLLTWLVTLPGMAEPPAGGLRFATGKERVSLIELYTSEGCSSCPPADRWLSGLKADARLWKRFIPVAFHVDYWDYIGWEDRFARPAYSDRQRAYAEAGRARTVYTPGFFTGGYEWSGYFTGQQPQIDENPVGVFELNINGEVVTARFEPRYVDYGELTLHVALLGMERESEVDAGENRGRKLEHDFVVLQLRSGTMRQADAGFRGEAMFPGLESQHRPLAVAAWITEAGDLTPIQAAGGPL